MPLIENVCQIERVIKRRLDKAKLNKRLQYSISRLHFITSRLRLLDLSVSFFFKEHQVPYFKSLF